MADNTRDLSDDIIAPPLERHRCTPPIAGRPKIGQRYTCSCGSEYVWRDTRIGRQWLPT